MYSLLIFDFSCIHNILMGEFNREIRQDKMKVELRRKRLYTSVYEYKTYTN
jgi:hypothetical protein